MTTMNDVGRPGTDPNAPRGLGHIFNAADTETPARYIPNFAASRGRETCKVDTAFMS